jgi:hypothetical protein
LLGKPIVSPARRWFKSQDLSAPHDPGARSAVRKRWADAYWLTVARWVIGAVVVIQFSLGIHFGLTGAKNDYGADLVAAHILRNINTSSNLDVVYHLYVFQSPSFIRAEAGVLEVHHLSLFANGGK